ncbi:Uncharacterised protein [Mycobacteroides abscessus]|nr:Uncharacterised protein [Mycobacteroides abscessus]
MPPVCSRTFTAGFAVGGGAGGTTGVAGAFLRGLALALARACPGAPDPDRVFGKCWLSAIPASREACKKNVTDLRSVSAPTMP